MRLRENNVSSFSNGNWKKIEWTSRNLIYELVSWWGGDVGGVGRRSIKWGRTRLVWEEGMGVSGKKEIELVKMWCSRRVRPLRLLILPLPNCRCRFSHICVRLFKSSCDLCQSINLSPQKSAAAATDWAASSPWTKKYISRPEIDRPFTLCFRAFV